MLLSEESVYEEGRAKGLGSLDLHNFREFKNTRTGPSVTDHFALILVSLVFMGPSVFLLWGK